MAKELYEIKRLLEHIRNDKEFQPHTFLVDDLKIDWLIVQAEKVEVLERQLEHANAWFTHYEEPVPKRTFSIKMKVSPGGRLPVAPERD